MAQKAQRAAEGARLAEACPQTIAGLVKFDPKAAIDLSPPYSLRKNFPREVAENKRLSAR